MLVFRVSHVNEDGSVISAGVLLPTVALRAVSARADAKPECLLVPVYLVVEEMEGVASWASSRKILPFNDDLEPWGSIAHSFRFKCLLKNDLSSHLIDNRSVFPLWNA